LSKKKQIYPRNYNDFCQDTAMENDHPTPKTKLLQKFREGKIISIKCGEDHRFIGLWPVVVVDKIFVRSWALDKMGWYHAFLKNPKGYIRINKMEIEILTRPVRSIRLNQLISQAYVDKYTSPGALKYVKDLIGKRSARSTTEILPIL